MSIKKLIFVIVAGAISLLFLQASSPASAQEATLTDDQVSLIKRNCQSSKVTLERLHASDALLRVNRGQVYEALSTRLMDNFNARLSNNRLDNRAMVTVTDSYKTTLNNFRAKYKLYEESLASAIKVDCIAEPRHFHESLEDAREKRKKIHQEVVKLHRLVDDYRNSIDDFMLNFDRKAS